MQDGGAEKHLNKNNAKENDMKISTDSIEGFAEMTAEQQVQALLGLDLPDTKEAELEKMKAAFDRTSSELAEAKKTIKSKMTEDEAAAAERDAKWAEMEAKLAKLEQEKMESTYKASYLALGYDDALAEDTAKAMVSGDMAKVFENQKKAAEAAEKKLKAELMRNNPHPGGAGGGNENEKTKAVQIAEGIGKGRAEATTAANDILSKYTGGK